MQGEEAVEYEEVKTVGSDPDHHQYQKPTIE
jgi:hypothetical protein